MRYAPILTGERGSENRLAIRLSRQKVLPKPSAIHPLPRMLGGRMRYTPTLTDEGSQSILLPFIHFRGCLGGVYNRYLRKRLKDPA